MIFAIANLLIKGFNLKEESATRAARWIVLIGFVAIIAGLICGGLWVQNCRLQREVEREREARSQQSQEVIEEKREEVNQSANKSNQSLQNVQKIENANFSNTNLDKANQLRCKAFPERCR